MRFQRYVTKHDGVQCVNRPENWWERWERRTGKKVLVRSIPEQQELRKLRKEEDNA